MQAEEAKGIPIQNQVYPQQSGVRPQASPNYGQTQQGQPPIYGQQGYQQQGPGYGQPGYGPQFNQQRLQMPPPQRDFNVPPPGYIPPRYEREVILENAEAEALTGSYQKYIYNLGECCGCLRAWLPICCVEYPFIEIEQGNVGLFERFGKYVKTVEPGLTQFNPCTDVIITVDKKVKLIDCPRQWVMTKDNILVSVDATVYYRIVVPRKAQYYIDNVHQSVSHLTLATIKTVAGTHTLQELLEKRQAVTDEIEKFVDMHVWEWGIIIENMLIKDIQLNQDLQNTLSMVAKEQRAAQAKIISAQADVQSAKLMSEAAAFLDSKAAMQIRYLETISILGKQGSTKVVFMPEDK